MVVSQPSNTYPTRLSADSIFQYEINDGSESTHSSIASRDPYSIRTTSPGITSLVTRYQFYESERANLVEKMHGWSTAAIKARLFYHWYGFGMWVNQANLSQPGRRAARAENYEKRMDRHMKNGHPVLCYLNICQICGCGDWDYWGCAMACLCPT